MDALDDSKSGAALAPQNLIALSIAAILSVGAVVAATFFHQVSPPVRDPVPALRTDRLGVTLSREAQQSQAIGLAPVTSPGEQWSATYAARFRVDEASTAHVWPPVVGRISKVFVELGEQVKRGDKLFSVAARSTGSVRVEGDRVVVAPRAGTVVRRAVQPLQQVDSDDVLIDISDLGTLWAVADVFETDADRIQVGSRVLLTSPLVPGFSREANVTVVAAVADPIRQTVRVRAAVPNADQQLRPNTEVEMRFHLPDEPGAVEVTASAVLSDGASSHVYLQQGDGHFVRRDVRTAWSHADRIVVTSGLRLGDVIVERGAALLDDETALEN